MKRAFNDKYIKYKRKGSKKLSIEQYFENIKPYFSNMIDELKKSSESKILFNNEN